MFANYERLVEVVLIKVEADRRCICACLNTLIAGVFRHDAFRQSLKPYMLDAAVVSHVVVFCPAHSGHVDVSSSDAQPDGIRYRFADAVCCVESHKVTVARNRQDSIMVDRTPCTLFTGLADLEVTCDFRIVDRNDIREFERDGLTE